LLPQNKEVESNKKRKEKKKQDKAKLSGLSSVKRVHNEQREDFTI
jgi:hypothetical protein